MLCVLTKSSAMLSATLNVSAGILVFSPHLGRALLEERALDIGLTHTRLELIGTSEETTGLGG